MNPSRLAVRNFAFVVLAGLSGAASAQWLPTWIGEGEYPQALHAMSARNVRVGNNGAVYAGIVLTHHGVSHAAVLRFDADGDFAWLHELETPSGSAAGIELIASGRVVIVGASAGRVFVRVIDGASGAFVWERESSSGRLFVDDRHDTRRIAHNADGVLMVALDSGGDYVVIRFSADGKPLPEWRWSSGFAEISATEISATSDGGAVVTGSSKAGDGFWTVRFNFDGSARFVDGETGEIGNPLGPSRVRMDDNDAAIVVASPETGRGVPGAMAWKLDESGKRSWTVELSEQSSHVTTFANGPYLLTPAGDPLIAIDDVFNQEMRVIRLLGSSGAVAQDHLAKIEANRITTLGLSAAGRVLVGGFASIAGSGGLITSRIVEFAASGPQCRQADALGMNSALAATNGKEGWYVLGIPPAVAGIGSDARLLHFDANGACDNGVEDIIFASSFDLR